MLSSQELRTLDAALERIVPGDVSEEVRTYVLDRAALQADLYRAGLILLSERGFVGLSLSAQDSVLRGLETHPSIVLLVQHAVEGLYTSAAGLAAVGFRVTA